MGGRKRGVLSSVERLSMLDELEDITHVERVLPDYTWPQRVPLDILRRQIERESREAMQLAGAAHLPTQP